MPARDSQIPTKNSFCSRAVVEFWVLPLGVKPALRFANVIVCIPY